VLFGDSLIDFGPWYELLPEFPIHPRGIAGDLLDGFTPRVDEVASQNPDAVVLIGGCNNLVKTPERAPEDIWKDYETLLATLRKAMPAVPLFVESILPLSPKDEAEYEGFNARAAVLNGFLADAATQAKYNYRYLDLAFQLRDMKGDLGDEYTTDGCHLTPAAYQIWADQLREALGGLNLKQR
jgi:lysophospholipase L1-like esterase